MPQMLQMPVLVPCPVTRRMSPAEDYMMTLTGVGNLIDQQQQLLRNISPQNILFLTMAHLGHGKYLFLSSYCKDSYLALLFHS